MADRPGRDLLDWRLTARKPCGVVLGGEVSDERGDALDKLEKLRVVEKVGDRYRARPLAKALEMLDWTWDNYFKYNNPQPEQAPVT